MPKIIPPKPVINNLRKCLDCPFVFKVTHNKVRCSVCEDKLRDKRKYERRRNARVSQVSQI